MTSRHGAVRPSGGAGRPAPAAAAMVPGEDILELTGAPMISEGEARGLMLSGAR